MKIGATILEQTVRISLLLLIGLALLATMVWYARYCYEEMTGTGEVVIDPMTSVDEAGKANSELGKALALMLQSRLQSLGTELTDAQRDMGMGAGPASDVKGSRRVGDVRLWQELALHTGLLSPVDMKLTVGGVDVGGMLPWIQRQMTSRRTLHFTVYFHGDEAEVLGTLSPMRLQGPGIRLLVKGVDSKPPRLDAIVDMLAHEIVRRNLAKDKANHVDSLDPAEFKSLASVVLSAASSNRRAILGRQVDGEFRPLVAQAKALADQVPEWVDLSYFTAWIADKAKDSDTAITYYHRVVPKYIAAGNTELVAFINARLTSLEVPTPVSGVAAQVAPAAMQPSVDYTPNISRVRDSGPEGSVVGQALATALEFQLQKAGKKDVQLSARYIYYAAREASGSTTSDSGAIIADGVTALATKGAVEESVWPYKPGDFAAKPPREVEQAPRFKVTAAKAVHGLTDLRKALIENGPIVAGIEMFESAMSPRAAKTGEISMPSAKAPVIGGHAIVIVGYDDAKRRVKFVNSWGDGWGDHGFGYLPYEYIEKYMNDAWTFKAG